MSKNSQINNDGYNRLARVMQGRVKKVSQPDRTTDFGVIQDDYSLLLNHYPIPIPRTDYFVGRHLTLGEKDDILTKTQSTSKDNSGSHTHAFALQAGPYTVAGTIQASQDSRHVHDVLIPEKMRWLKPGDHVLAVWVDNDVTVIDIIVPATEVG